MIRFRVVTYYQIGSNNQSYIFRRNNLVKSDFLLYRRFLCLFLLLISFRCYSYDINVNITGEVYIPPCIINNNQVINIDFGKINISDIDGYKNFETVSIPISCNRFQGVPHIKVSGQLLDGAPDNVLSTNTPFLGVALYTGEGVDESNRIKVGGGSTGYGNKINEGLSPIGTEIGKLTLTAVPYTSNRYALGTGQFKSSALISMTYL